MTWLFDSARKFHITACNFLQKYFKLGLSSIIMDNMSGLAPSSQSHILTGDKLVYLAVKYSKVVDNIQTIDGMDRLKDEIRRYVTDDDVKELCKDTFEEFWDDVGKLTDGGAGWLRYEILPRFALGLGTKHDATGDVERGFSTMNLIHQNKQRNAMEQDTLNAHLLIKAGVEAKEVTKNCDKCKIYPIVAHCHCELFEVHDLMREKCKVAWQKCLNAQASAAITRKEVTAEMEERKKKYDVEEVSRIEKEKETLAVKSVFCSAKCFEPVYILTEKSKKTKAVSKTPSAKSPGAKSPGAKTPGAKTPGAKTPGAKTPGAKTSGAKTPGAKTPSAKTPSAKTPSAKTPSVITTTASPSAFRIPRKSEEKDYNSKKKSSHGVKRKAGTFLD